VPYYLECHCYRYQSAVGARSDSLTPPRPLSALDRVSRVDNFPVYPESMEVKPPTMEEIAQMLMASGYKNAGAYFGHVVSPPGHSDFSYVSYGTKPVSGVDFRVASHLDPEYRRKEREQGPISQSLY